MATIKKTTVDPLVAALPPETPLQPQSADVVDFLVEISPYVLLGMTYWRWEIVEHGYKGFTGDHVGQREGQWPTADEAEASARAHVDRIRQTVQKKLDAPNSYRITL